MITYYSVPGGGVAVREGDNPDPPFGWSEITEADYADQLFALEAADEANAAAIALTECMARKAVYDDLKASSHTVDWAEATFRALSRYSPGDC